MNLKRHATYIIFIWLPIANLQLINNKNNNNNHNKFNDQKLENEKNILSNHIEKKKENAEIIEEKAEERGIESLFQVHDYEIAFSRNRASEISPNEKNNSANISAGSGVKISSVNKKTEPKNNKNDKSAQKLTHSVKKDLSALHVINFVRKRNNKSADVLLPKKIEDSVKNSTFKRRDRKKMRKKREAVLRIPKPNFNGDDDDDEERSVLDDDIEDLDEDDIDETNTTELGTYLGSPCEFTCSAKLLHVFCDPGTQICECEKKYPVQIGIGKGCAKPKQLDDQCFYSQTCSFYDPNAICAQIDHNAKCQCKPGFHKVALQKGVKKMFCSEDLVVLTADLPTLLGVITGIAILTGLICFVLKLFSYNRYPHPRHYANANLAPPLLFSSDNQWINGIPLTVHGRPSSRSSSQRSTTNLAHYSRNKGVLVPASRAGAARAAAILLIPCHLQASRTSEPDVINNSNNDDTDVQENDLEQSSHPGSRRPSISSIHSTASSQKSMSYSARRFEQENHQREQRAAMRAAREEAARIAAPPTPSPMSTDELLPSCSKIEDDPLGFSSSVLSVKSGVSPRESSIPEFPENLSETSSPILRH